LPPPAQEASPKAKRIGAPQSSHVDVSIVLSWAATGDHLDFLNVSRRLVDSVGIIEIQRRAEARRRTLVQWSRSDDARRHSAAMAADHLLDDLAKTTESAESFKRYLQAFDLKVLRQKVKDFVENDGYIDESEYRVLRSSLTDTELSEQDLLTLIRERIPEFEPFAWQPTSPSTPPPVAPPTEPDTTVPSSAPPRAQPIDSPAEEIPPRHDPASAQQPQSTSRRSMPPNRRRWWLLPSIGVPLSALALVLAPSREPRRDAAPERAAAMAPSSPQGGFTCQIDGPARSIGESADPTMPLGVAANGLEVAVGWRVTGRRGSSLGRDTAAIARLSMSGERTGWVSPEAADPDRFTEWAPRSIQRVLPVWRGSEWHGTISEVERSERSETVRCGALVSTWPVDRLQIDSSDEIERFGDAALGTVPAAGRSPTDRPTHLPPTNASTFFGCRVVATSQPFVVGTRLVVTPEGAPSGEVALVATPLSGGAEVELLRYSARQVLARFSENRNLLAVSRERLFPHSIVGVDVPSHGYALSFRVADRVYLGWLRPDLGLQASLASVELAESDATMGLAVQGDLVLVVYAAHRGDAHSLYGISMRHGETPRPRVELWTRPGRGDRLHSPPAVAALPGGNWLIAWSEESSGDDSPSVWAQTFAPDLHPLGSAVCVLHRATAPVLAASEDRAIVVAMRSGGEPRSAVIAAPIRCHAP